jgi:hypothetical protein
MLVVLKDEEVRGKKTWQELKSCWFLARAGCAWLVCACFHVGTWTEMVAVGLVYLCFRICVYV